MKHLVVEKNPKPITNNKNKSFHQLQEIKITQSSTFNIFVRFLCSVIHSLQKSRYKIFPGEKALQKNPDVLKPAVNCSSNLRLRSVSQSCWDYPSWITNYFSGYMQSEWLCLTGTLCCRLLYRNTLLEWLHFITSATKGFFFLIFHGWTTWVCLFSLK